MENVNRIFWQLWRGDRKILWKRRKIETATKYYRRILSIQKKLLLIGSVTSLRPLTFICRSVCYNFLEGAGSFTHAPLEPLVFIKLSYKFVSVVVIFDLITKWFQNYSFKLKKLYSFKEFAS